MSRMASARSGVSASHRAVDMPSLADGVAKGCGSVCRVAAIGRCVPDWSIGGFKVAAAGAPPAQSSSSWLPAEREEGKPRTSTQLTASCGASCCSVQGQWGPPQQGRTHSRTTAHWPTQSLLKAPSRYPAGSAPQGYCKGPAAPPDPHLSAVAAEGAPPPLLPLLPPPPPTPVCCLPSPCRQTAVRGRPAQPWRARPCGRAGCGRGSACAARCLRMQMTSAGWWRRR